jgi:hypothetical protein
MDRATMSEEEKESKRNMALKCQESHRRVIVCFEGLERTVNCKYSAHYELTIALFLHNHSTVS